MGTESDATTSMLPRPLRSSAFLSLTSALALATFLTAYPRDYELPGDAHVRTPLCDAARRWHAKYPNRSDLLAIVTEVTFRGDPGSFVPGEAAIVAPVAVSLPGAQNLLEVEGVPPPTRVLRAGGVTSLAWPYAGTLHRDIRVVGLALVSRAPLERFVPPDAPTFEALPQDQRVDATMTVAELEEHELAGCKAFVAWARETAGSPPYTEQLLRLARWVSEHTRRGWQRRTDDVCSALREERLAEHDAHVLAVMAAREVGIPAYGFIGAEGARAGLYIGTYVDGAGWVTLDLADTRSGYAVGGPGLITMAPPIGHFEASEDGFWGLTGAAYSTSPLGTLWAMSKTGWANRSDSGDTTVVRAVPLAEACR